MKIGITMDDKLAKRVDDYAQANYTTRSGLIAVACNQYLNTAEVAAAIKDMAITMRKIADTGTLDQDSKEKLEDFERLAKMIM